MTTVAINVGQIESKRGNVAAIGLMTGETITMRRQDWQAIGLAMRWDAISSEALSGCQEAARFCAEIATEYDSEKALELLSKLSNILHGASP